MIAQKLFDEAIRKQMSNDLEGAKNTYKKLLRLHPSHPTVLTNLGAIARRQGQADTAETLLMRALRANPDNPAALSTLSNLRLIQHRYDDALEFAESALKIAPNYPEAYINLGAAYAKRGQVKKAESAFRLALAIAPHNAAARMNIANCFRMQKQDLTAAIKELETLAVQEPNNDELMSCLAMAYGDNRQFARALEYAERAYKLSNKFEYVNYLASMQIVLGEFETAMQHYQAALRIDPNNHDAALPLLFALNYDDRLTAEAVFKEYQKFGASLSGKYQMTHETHPPTAGRRLRIGYVSPDYYAHVCMYFMEPIFRSHDHSKFEVFAYSNVVHADEVTLRVKREFDHWVDVSDMADEELAQKIKADRIDVLIDLAGHTSGNRLRAFGFNPAPVQCTYLGYGYTTGLKEMTYFIGDQNFAPEGCEHLFSEKIFRIPSPLYAYEAPLGHTLPVNELPARAKGYVTFGSMSRIIRFNNRLLRTWKQILDRVPGSKLRLDQKPLGDEETRERVIRRFEALGYRRDQLELVSSHPHWKGYHEFDISLDCWPHNAGTTTFEALWMGVPVLSKRDRPSVGRLSQMVLQPLGLDDWIVDTEEEFVERAVAAANDLDRLAELRATLRARIENSAFCDFGARTRALEEAYTEMMRRFEEGQS
jgi:protein O-GlcNAc transferase